MSFKIQLLGVRGTLPRPLPPWQIDQKIEQAIKAFLVSGKSSAYDVSGFLEEYPRHLAGGFGGHTTCVEVFDDINRLIIDCGTGLTKRISYFLENGFSEGDGELHILMTHFHWDHLLGLLNFAPLFIPGNKFHFYAVQDDLAESIKSLFRKPFFPVPFESLQSDIQFHKLQPREKSTINGFEVTPYQLDHPDPCWGYKIEKRGATYSHCVDTECTRSTPEMLGADLPLYQNIDVMLFDAQYSIQEATKKINWGHAAANFGLDLALTENIRNICFVHHDPMTPDTRIKEISTDLKLYHDNMSRQMKKNNVLFNEVEWQFAYEDLIIGVGT